MTNRIGRYLGNLNDVDRAADTLRFCDAIVDIHGSPRSMAAWEISELSELQIEAVKVFRNLGQPLPWERA